MYSIYCICSLLYCFLCIYAAQRCRRRLRQRPRALRLDYREPLLCRVPSPRATPEGYDWIVRKHAAPLRAAEPRASFCPMAVTALGVWNVRSLIAIGDLTRFVASAGVTTGYARRELIWRLSVAICRGNFRLSSVGRDRPEWGSESEDWPYRPL